MKKIVLSFLLLIVFVSCTSQSIDDYHIISELPVDGYYIYKLDQKGFFCNTSYEDIYYSDETYNYGFTFVGCSPGMTFFIYHNEEFIYLKDALDLGMISMESLILELDKLPRNPEEITNEKADYYWLDYYIYGKAVYAYAGGECDFHGSESFVIDGERYIYNASGCLKENILFMEEDGEMIPVSQLLLEEKIDGKYLIPLLETE